MRIIFTACILLVAFPLFSQVRTISGRLTSSEDGSPLPGVNVVVKETKIGTVTDADGWYTIEAPVGSTLVFSFIGLATQEIVVTETNLRSSKPKNRKPDRVVKEKPIPASLYKDSTVSRTPGVTVMTEKSAVYKKTVDPASVRVIRRKQNGVVIRANRDPARRTGFGLQFSSSITMENITRLPEFQDQFSQGRPSATGSQWRGADEQEIFSWGPLVRTLEFDGSDYLFDKRGRLVTAGSGNGVSARKYDPSGFFRTGITTVNELILSLPTARGGTFNFDIENRNKSGVIPNSSYRRLNMLSTLRDFDLSKSIRLQTSLSYNHSAGDLLNRGANMASIIGSVYRTPVTFDNANDIPARRAENSPETYITENGSIRSHAPGIADNPYGLANLLPDKEEQDRIVGTWNMKHHADYFYTVLNGSIDHQVSNNVFGTPPGYAAYPPGRLTSRNDEQTYGNVVFSPTLDLNKNDIDFKLAAAYQLQYTRRALDRKDGLGFESGDFGNPDAADVVISTRETKLRTSHEISLTASYIHDQWLTTRVANRQYFSNTARRGSFTNLFPSAGISIDFTELTDLYPFDHVKVFSSLSRTIREAPLLYSNWSYGSTSTAPRHYASFYENSELFFDASLMPETERKMEAGLRVALGGSRVIVDAVYFNNVTSAFVAPMVSGGQFHLQNAADVKNYGATVTASFTHNGGRGTLGTEFKWSTYNSTVQSIYSDQEFIPLSGFSTVQSVLAPGRPLGAIYGTTYKVNTNGQYVIGADGFPIKENALTMIGNPIPDWTLAWSAYLQLHHFRFSFLFDFRRGGDVWNGTNAALDYLGRSRRSGDERNIANYVFEGVYENGNANSTPVSFASPAGSLDDNRWVRYGWEGVGQENIEDASWMRLSELAISYTVRRPFESRAIKDLRLSLMGRNLFLITPYSGVDPSSTLYGNAMATGLDMFNMPATRTFSAQITIKI